MLVYSSLRFDGYSQRGCHEFYVSEARLRHTPVQENSWSEPITALFLSVLQVL